MPVLAGPARSVVYSSYSPIIGLFKGEVIHYRGRWRMFNDVEYATLECVDWFNNRRLLEPIGNVPPAELETAYHRQHEESALAA